MPWARGKLSEQGLQRLLHRPLAEEAPLIIALRLRLRRAGPLARVAVTCCGSPTHPAMHAAHATTPQNTDFGLEKSASIQNLDTGAVAAKLQELIKAGEKLPRCGSGWRSTDVGAGDSLEGGAFDAWGWAAEWEGTLSRCGSAALSTMLHPASRLHRQVWRVTLPGE